MNYYLLTNELSKDWKNRNYQENTSLSEDNDNYHFLLFDNPDITLLMNPLYENYSNPKIWEVKCNPNKLSFMYTSNNINIIKEISANTLTLEQCITFGILACLNCITKDKKFIKWAYDYLNGKKETIDYDCPIISAINEQSEIRCACAIHWAWNKNPFNITEFLNVVKFLPPQEIVKMLEIK